jgi:hypothetical protein
MSNFPEDRPKDRGIVKLSSALQQAPFTIVIASISIICGVAGIAAAVLMPFWQSLIIIVLLNLLIIAALWHRFPVTQRFPPIESRIFLLLMIPLLRDGPFYDVAKQVFKRIPTTERRLCGARRLVTDCRRKIEMTSLCKVGVR